MRRALLMLALALSGCSAEYAYLPVENATAQVNGQTAATYAVPPEAPQGEVRIASFGIAPLKLESGEEVRALHLRMTLANRAAGGWSVDTREQLCAIAGEGQSRPIFASADAGGMPVLVVAPGSSRTLDLFYPLPYPMQSAKHLPQFDLLWRVDVGGRAVALRTPFERVVVEPTAVAYEADYDRPAWWGPYWWYDPVYVDYTFVHPFYYRRPVVVVGPRLVGPPPRVWIHRPVFVGPPPVIVRPPPPVYVRPRPPVYVPPPPRRR